MNRTKFVKTLNTVLNAVPNIGGQHRDQYWVPVHALRKSLEDAGFDIACVKSEYNTDPKTGNPTSKTWLYEVAYTSEAGTVAPAYVRIVAAGAGSVAEPLSSYDVVCYAS